MSQLDFYDTIHSKKQSGTDYDRTSHLKIKATSRILNRITGDIFVDIGCGDGSITASLRDTTKFKRYLAIDISPYAAREAQTRDIDVLVADLSHGIPLTTNSVNAMLCGDIVEHFVDVDHFLREVYRVLAPGAHCLIATPNLAWYPNRLMLLLGLQPIFTEPSYTFDVTGPFSNHRYDVPAGHIHVMTLRALKKLLRLHGFTIIDTVGISILERHMLRRGRAPWWVYPFQPLDRILSHIPGFAPQILVTISKES